MAVEKKIKYDMQGGVRNYLGKQKTASNVPLRWKSGPNAPDTELAYITKAEKDLLLKKDIHGSLKNGPNTGPEGIMSLDSQGDMGGSEDKGTNEDGSANSGKGDPDNNREQYGAVGQYSGPTSSPKDNDNTNREKGILSQFKGPKGTTGNINDLDDFDGPDKSAIGPTSLFNINKFAPKVTKKTPLDYVKQILSIASVLSPHTLVGKIGLGLTTYDKVKTGLQTVSSIADTFGINTDSITNSLSNNFSGKKSNTTTNTNTNNGGDGEGLASLENQSGSYDEYVLLLQKLQSGNISDVERTRYTMLKNMLGI